MNKRLLDLLVCPLCRAPFRCEVEAERDGENFSGRLFCRCGSYPIRDFIPRLLEEHRTPAGEEARVVTDAVRSRTRESFGYQWTAFGRMTDAFDKRRRVVNALIESVRAVTTSLPLPILNILSYLAAAIDYGLFVAPARFARNTFLDGWLPPRLRLYREYPFQVSAADWFDRLAAPVRFYYDEKDLTDWAERANWESYRIEPTGLYGFRLQSLQTRSWSAAEVPPPSRPQNDGGTPASPETNRKQRCAAL